MPALWVKLRSTSNEDIYVNVDQVVAIEHSARPGMCRVRSTVHTWIVEGSALDVTSMFETAEAHKARP
jgi:hypothetical protein